MGSCVSHVQPRSEFLTPQVPIENLNVKAVKRRIKSGMLAPFYVGVEADTDTTFDKDECPICFLSYPMLNTSLCCGKRICTTCLMMIQSQGHAGCQNTPCPFCKAPSHAVRFFGSRSMDEKLEELAEEQKMRDTRRRQIEEELERDQERQLQRLMGLEQQDVQQQAPPPPPPPQHAQQPQWPRSPAQQQQQQQRLPQPRSSPSSSHQRPHSPRSPGRRVKRDQHDPSMPRPAPPPARHRSGSQRHRSPGSHLEPPSSGRSSSPQHAAPSHLVQLQQLIPEDLARMYTIAELDEVMLEWALYQSARSSHRVQEAQEAQDRELAQALQREEQEASTLPEIAPPSSTQASMSLPLASSRVRAASPAADAGGSQVAAPSLERLSSSSSNGSRQQLAQLVAALAIHGQPDRSTATVGMVGVSEACTPAAAAALKQATAVPQVAVNPDGTVATLLVCPPDDPKPCSKQQQEAGQDAAGSSTSTYESPLCEPADQQLHHALDEADARFTQALQRGQAAQQEQQASPAAAAAAAAEAAGSAGSTGSAAADGTSCDPLATSLDSADAAFAERLRQQDLKYRAALGIGQ